MLPGKPAKCLKGFVKFLSGVSGNGFTLIVLLVQPPPKQKTHKALFYIVDYLIGKYFNLKRGNKKFTCLIHHGHGKIYFSPSSQHLPQV